MNMYGLGKGLEDLNRNHNIMKYIEYLGGVDKCLPKMKQDLLNHELKNFKGSMNMAERNLLFHD